MDVGDWLRTLGLERYEEAFRENAVTSDLIPSLTAEDLKDLGITAVGHRRRLLDAASALRGNNESSDHLRRHTKTTESRELSSRGTSAREIPARPSSF
jgi:hypothetical protein